MPDLVGTCPKAEFDTWCAEGDPAGTPETGEEYGWYTGDRKAASMKPGDRFYVVSRGKLRGWAPVVRVEGHYAIIRRGGAVACTITELIHGFRGLRYRWWNREDEQPFENWREP